MKFFNSVYFYRYLLKSFFIFLFFNSEYSATQFSKETIETDSSTIEIIRNSLYRVYEESYKNKDLIWFSVRYINDTSRVKEEGWETKYRRRFGVWSEYTIDGTLVYTVNYDYSTWYINEAIYPDHNIIERMKLIADSLVISVYGEEFYNKHIRFTFKCGAYDENGRVGDWLEPLERKPNEFLFIYDIKLDSAEYYQDMVGIWLDSNGRYKEEDDYYSNLGFENVQSTNMVFKLNKNTAIKKSQEYGLVLTDSSDIDGFLKWEKNKSKEFYRGSFRYYVTELYDVIKDIHEKERSRITYRYYVYSFNPWTGEFVEKKKMKRIQEWEKFSGLNTGFIPDE